MTERRPGNAAVQYMIAADRLPAQPRYDDPRNKAWAMWNRLDEQMMAPIEQFSPAIAAEVLDQISVTAIDTASRRDHADWDNDFRGAGINTLLPQLNSMRVMANIVTLRTRLDVANSDYSAADRSLQTAFAMTWHLNDQPVLVQALVGCGIAQLTLNEDV